MAFSLVQIIFWIALSTWLGGVLFIAIAAPIIFRTVKESNPIIPTVLAVNLDNQHGSLLAGTIVGNLISQLVRIELGCAGALLVAMGAHWKVIDTAADALLPAILRSAMYLLLVAIVIYEWRVLWPKIRKQREQYIDHADDPDVANPAKEEFDRLHKESVLLLLVRAALLIGMVVFSASISPRHADFQMQRTGVDAATGFSVSA